jgi:hypothetical protein
VLEIMQVMRNQLAHNVRHAPSRHNYFALGAAVPAAAPGTSRPAGSGR